MLLPLPPTFQDLSYNCGEAAVACALAFHRIVATVPRFASPHDGSDPRQLESCLRRLGMRVLSGEMTVADLRHFCDDGRPPIALVHWADDRDSHYILARGVSRGRVFFHDVETGPGSCALREWHRAWAADGRIETFRHWGIVAWPG